MNLKSVFRPRVYFRSKRWGITPLMLKGNLLLRPPHCLELLPDQLYLCSFLFPPHSFFFLSSSPPIPLSHDPFFTPSTFLISFHSPLNAILAPLRFHLFPSCINPSLYPLYFKCQPVSLSSHTIILCTSMPCPQLLFYST